MVQGNTDEGIKALVKMVRLIVIGVVLGIILVTLFVIGLIIGSFWN